jgi:hypothetical protein
METKAPPHLYGSPDASSRDTSPEGGLRGERAPTGDAKLKRKDGEISIEEQSGTAAAEILGAGEQKERQK